MLCLNQFLSTFLYVMGPLLYFTLSLVIGDEDEVVTSISVGTVESAIPGMGVRECFLIGL